jgi:CheY-like chemotaxis protein
VDDDIDLLQTLVRLLGRFGYTCLTASSGDEAIRLMDGEAPDLVVTDLRMPGLDGVAVARRAREHAPPIPVVLMTVYQSRETDRLAEEVGVTIHFAKPFASVDFVSAVQRALAGSGVASDQ